jgi:hypothetical protein
MVSVEVVMIAAEVETSAWSHMDADFGGCNTQPLEKWCQEMLGPKAEFRDQVSDQYPWTVSYTGFGNFVWHFACAESATMFRLRWGYGN